LGTGRWSSPCPPLGHQPRATATSSYTPSQPVPGGAERSDEASAELGDNTSDIYQSDNSELGFDDHDLEGWEDMESDGGSELDGNHDEEEEFGGI
jgi:hypothetical protein